MNLDLGDGGREGLGRMYERLLAVHEEGLLTYDEQNPPVVPGSHPGDCPEGADPRPASPLYEQTLAGMRRVLGEDHRNTLVARNNLAFIYHMTGNLPRAITAYEEALTGMRRVLGADHPDTLAVEQNLRTAHRQAG
jgi:hypothetical protein